MPKPKVMIAACVVALICLVAWAVPPRSAPLSFQLCGYKTNKIVDDFTLSFFTNGLWISAVLCITNSSSHPVSYIGSTIQEPFYECSALIDGKWINGSSDMRGERWIDQTPLRMDQYYAQQTLKPSQSVIFEVGLGHPQLPRHVRRISLAYSQQRLTDKLWGLLPQWLAKRLAWIKSTRTALITIDSRP
jgi:hypothetical protein